MKAASSKTKDFSVQRTLKKKYGIQAFLWTALIYSTLPWVRPVCEILRKAIPLSAAVNILFMVLLIVLLGRFSSYFFANNFRACGLWLICLLYGVVLAKLPLPEERIHLLQYGFLVFLVFRAFAVDQKGVVVYLKAFALTSMAGWIDECIQGILPNRYYQISDVVLNALSGLMALGIIFFLSQGRAHHSIVIRD